MDRVVLVVVAIALSVFSYSLWDKNGKLQEDLAHEVEKGKISIDSSMLTKATEFTFMKVTNKFTYYMDEDDIGPLKGKWRAIYHWDYPFNFGYKIKDQWKWCIHVDQDKGEVTLNAPKVVQLNASSASPVAEKIFNGGMKPTQTAAQQWMVDLANSKMKEVADAYLDNSTVKESVKNSLASFFQDILNDAQPGNPVRKVIVKEVAVSSCS